MTAQKGSLLLLKVGNGAIPEIFTTVGGLRVSGLTHNNQSLDTSNQELGAWRALLDGAGMRSIGISGSGVFTDSASEELLRGFAMNNQIKNYQLTFGNGDTMSGAFQIISYQRVGSYGTSETYALSLLSASEVTFTPA